MRILGERPDGLDRAVELMRRACAPLEPNGKPLFAGAQSQPWPDDAWASSSSPATSSASSGATPTPRRGRRPGSTVPRSAIVSERYSGIPPRTYVRTRAWGTDRLDAAEERAHRRWAGSRATA